MMDGRKKKSIRLFILFVYLCSLIYFIFGEVWGLKYVSLNPYKIDVLWSAIFIWGIIPAAAIAVLFVKTSNKWLSVIKSILPVILILYFILINFLGVLGRGTVLCSMTDNVDDYKEFDEWLEAKEDSGEFGLLPKSLPENAQTEYHYFYSDGWEPEYGIYLRVKCYSLQQYTDLKEEILSDEAVKDIVSETEQEIVNYKLIHGSNVAQIVCDEETLVFECFIQKGDFDFSKLTERQLNDSQWCTNGYSRYLSVAYELEEAELTKIYESGGEAVYTYGISSCGVIRFWSGKTTSLSEALSDGYTMRDAINGLERIEADNFVLYIAENYIIVELENGYVITRNNMEYLETLGKLKI